MPLTNERIDAIFGEMNGYVLELAKDPGALGPKYFQDIIATCRNYLNRVSLVISEINRDRLEVSSELRKLEALYALDYDDLLANNDRVKSLSSVDDRKATVGFLLRDQRQKINELQDQMHSLDSVYKVISHRNRELHATMTAIKDQRRLMQTEIDTGAFYGDERAPRSSNGIVPEDDLGEDELAAMLSDSVDIKEVAPEVKDPNSIIPINPDPVEVATPINPDPISSEGLPQVTEEDVLRFLEVPEELLSEVPQPVVDQPQTDTSEIDDLLPFLEKI